MIAGSIPPKNSLEHGGESVQAAERVTSIEVIHNSPEATAS